MSAYDRMPVLRMSLENVARDFHLHVMTQHQEIQKYIEENLQATVDNYIETEMPKLVKSLVHEAANDVLRKKINGWNGQDKEIREQIEAAAEESLRKYLKDNTDEIAESAMYGHQNALRDKTKLAQIWRVLRAIVGGED